MALSKHVTCCDAAVGDSDCMGLQVQDRTSIAVKESDCIGSEIHEASTASTALKVSTPGGEYTHVTSELSSFGVPETKSRTNVG
eukprot:2695775-Amphidinium_carterae.1